MIQRRWKAAALAIALASLGQDHRAEAQWGYGWGSYGGYAGGGGGQTVQGDMARGMGVLAAGAGQYNQQTAVARSINADTAMRWNQYVYQSQLEANRRYQQKMARKRYGNEVAREKIADRLRNDPEPRDIDSGDALNVAYDEINDPRVYSRALKAATAKIGGQAIRDIPFQYAAAAISTSIHQVTTKGSAPAALKTPEFADERSALQALGASIREKTDAGESPNPADLSKALTLIDAAEARVVKVYPANSRERTDATKYLKSLRGLLRMMQGPALDFLLAGAENRPEATLGQLLMFMQAYNLRFGPATTPRQREVYAMLYPKLVALRAEVAPALAAASPSTLDGTEAASVFSGVNDQLLKPPAPPVPAPAPRP